MNLLFPPWGVCAAHHFAYTHRSLNRNVITSQLIEAAFDETMPDYYYYFQLDGH